MTIALAYAKLSSSPYTQIGACIVNNNMQIIGCGYNSIRRSVWEDQFYRYDWQNYNQQYIYGTYCIFSFLFFLLRK